MIIALDIMGGDHAPAAIVGGLKVALTDFPEIPKILLVGDEARVRQELQAQGLPLTHPRYDIIHASQVVEMADAPAAAVRGKKDSSITVAARTMRDGKADAVVSAGHTGAAVTSAVVVNRLLPGVERPAIATLLPTPHGPIVLLDAGANVDCKPLHLAQYAILGEAYSHFVMKVAEPRIGLMSVGEEDCKGNELTKATFAMLKRLPMRFVGNIEGRDLFTNRADVVICDGFVGNVVLKTCEGMAKALGTILKSRLQKTPLRKAGAFLSRHAFRELKQVGDHEEYGGAPLLGINGICIIGHGSSSPKAVRNAIRVAAELVRQKVNGHIVTKVSAVDWKQLVSDTAAAATNGH